MKFVNREPTVHDFPECLVILSDRFLYDRDRLRAIERFWIHVLECNVGMMRVVTPDDAPSKIVGFGVDVLISSERAQQYQACSRPAIVRDLLDEWSAGGAPFLNWAQIASANAADGVNVLVTHHGYLPTTDNALWSTLRFVVGQAFIESHAGLRIRSFTQEVYDKPPDSLGPLDVDFGFRIGFYAPESLCAAGIPLEKAPVVVFANHDDAVAHPGSMIARMFLNFLAPRCGFGEKEQQVLRLAMAGLTDEQIAVRLGDSLSVVKKKLRNIYDKADDAQVIESEVRGDAAKGGARGAEIRRRLLGYLRDHPEELRPYAPSEVRTDMHR